MKILIIYAHFSGYPENSSLLSFIEEDLAARGAEYKICDVNKLSFNTNNNISGKQSLSMALPEVVASCQREVMAADKIIVVASSKQAVIPVEMSDYLNHVFTEEFMFNLIVGGSPTFKCMKEFGILSPTTDVERISYKDDKSSGVVQYEYQQAIQDMKAVIRFNILLPEKEAQKGLLKESMEEIHKSFDNLINSCSPYKLGNYVDIGF